MDPVQIVNDVQTFANFPAYLENAFAAFGTFMGDLFKSFNITLQNSHIISSFSLYVVLVGVCLLIKKIKG